MPSVIVLRLIIKLLIIFIVSGYEGVVGPLPVICRRAE
jgi:hypothetical protein